MSATPGASTEADFSRTTFLVVDNKAVFRDMVHSALMRKGAKDVKHAGSVESALEIMSRLGQQIGCIICDWNMAPLGGLELLRMIRCKTLRKTAQPTPLIILTANANASAIQAAMALDVNGIAVAPLSRDKLIKTIPNGLTRQWNLQMASAYAAAHPVELPAATTENSGPPRAKASSAQNPGAARPAAPAMQALPRRPLEQKAVELKNIHMCALNKVRPGEILARDLHDRAGQLLLKSGTELKATLIDLLNTVAGGQSDSYHVWVGDIDKAG